MPRATMHMYCLAGLLILAAGSPIVNAAGETGHHAVPHHHLAFFAGLGKETKRDKPDENGFAVGFVYEYRFHDKWGVGGAVEGLGRDTIRDVSIVVPVSLHPSGHWRLFAGPGYEFTETKDKALARIGIGYEFPIGGHWTLAPEAIGDFIEGGIITWIGGIAIGRTF